MPFIDARFSVRLEEDKKAALRREFDEMICTLPGKSPAWLMSEIRDGADISFASSDAPCAFIGVSVFGDISTDACDRLTDALCSTVEKICKIPGKRIYIRYMQTDLWGWNGHNF